MRQRMSLRKSFALVLPLLLLVATAIIILALERVSKSDLYSNLLRNSRTGDYFITVPSRNGTASESPTTIDLGLNINSNPTLALLGVVALAGCVSALSAFGIWELRRVEGTDAHQRGWSWIVAVSSLVLVGVSAGVLGYMSALQSSESGWKSFEDFQQSQNDFTRETWVCQIHRFFPNQGWSRTACGTTTAARYLLIAIAIAAALILVSVWTIIRTRGGLRWLMGGKGRYAGFPSIYEMQPEAHAPAQYAQPGPYASHQYTQPESQWGWYPVQQWQQQPSPGPQYIQQSFPQATAQSQPGMTSPQVGTQAPNTGSPAAKRDVYT